MMFRNIKTITRLLIYFLILILISSCRKEYLGENEEPPNDNIENCDIVGKWILCFDEPFDVDLELCEDPEYLNSLPIWNFKEDRTLTIGGISGYRYSIDRCPTVTIDLPDSEQDIEVQITDLRPNSMVWNDSYFCLNKCTFVRLNPVSEPQDSLLSLCPDGIDVSCQEGIIGRWFWLNSPVKSVTDRYDYPDISFIESGFYGGNNGAPGGTQYRFTSECKFEILNHFGTVLREVEIIGIDENFMLLNDPEVLSEPMVYIKHWDGKINDEIDENFELTSNYLCENSNCNDCYFGICICDDKYSGIDCSSTIETYHQINNETFRDAQYLNNGDILIISLEDYQENSQVGLFRINPINGNVVWKRTISLDLESIWNAKPGIDAFIETESDEIIIAGRIKDASRNYFTRLVKLDKNGEEIFIKDYPTDIRSEDPNTLMRFGSDKFIVIYNYTNNKYPYSGLIFDFEGNFIQSVFLYAGLETPLEDPFSAHLSLPIITNGINNTLNFFYTTQSNEYKFYAETNEIDGKIIDIKEIDFFSDILFRAGENSFEFEPTLLNAERFNNHYLFAFKHVFMDYLYKDRIDSDQAIVITDSEFNKQNVLKVPNYFKPSGNNFGWQIDENGEVILASLNSDDNPVVMKYNSNGDLIYVVELTFPLYDIFHIYRIFKVTNNQYAIIGSANRYGNDVMLINFNDSNLQTNLNICN